MAEPPMTSPGAAGAGWTSATQADRLPVRLQWCARSSRKLLATHDVRIENETISFSLCSTLVEENKYLSRGLARARQAAEGLNVLVLEDAPSRLTSPSFRRISCSILR